MTSPSSLGREVECLASVVLPHTKSSGPRAVRGTDLHRYMCARSQARTDDERSEALEAVPAEWRSAAAAIDWDRMPPLNPETGVPELALAWSPSTGKVRELGRGGAVEHDDVAALLQGDEMGGIIDWLSLTPDAVFVADFKFGWQALERAEVNAQLRCYGLMAATLFGRDKALVSFARVFDSGAVWWDVAAMDGWKLEAAASFIRQHLKNTEAARSAFRDSGVIPAPIEGDWCRYCPAQNSCPAKVALLLSVFQGDEGKAAQLARLPEPLTAEMVVDLWPKLKAAEKLVERLQGNVKDYVRVFGAVKLKNGNVLGEVESPRETINPEYARAPLTERFGAESVERAIKREEKLTKESLDELLQAHSSHGMKAKLKRAVMDELAEAGALRASIIRSVAEVKATSKKLKANDEQEQHQLAAPQEQGHG